MHDDACRRKRTKVDRSTCMRSELHGVEGLRLNGETVDSVGFDLKVRMHSSEQAWLHAAYNDSGQPQCNRTMHARPCPRMHMHESRC